MSGEVGFKMNFVVLQPTNPSAVPNGSVFIDSTNADTASVKGTGGIVDPIGVTGGTSLFIKQMQAASAITLNHPVSKKPNGKIEEADSDAPEGQNIIGFALSAAAADGDLINVLCVGANITNGIFGLGFTPGDEIFLGESGGYTDDVTTFTGNDDSIIKVGIADCATGAASATATDLIIFPEVVARP